MKYKVGDRIRIKNLDWYNENKTVHGDIWFDNAVFVGGQSLYCGCELTIHLVTNDSYYVIENDYYWTNEMIEGLVEEKTKPNIIEEAKTYWDSIKDAWICPEGYQFKDENGNVINAHKIVLEKKEYPKTLEECCEVLDTGGYQIDYFVKPGEVYEYEKALVTKISALYNLIICRDAYWKLYGEEMGLDGSWKPIDNSEVCYGIFTWAGEICHNNTAKWCILTFPTAEMRDVFYENFEELIESAKELL